MDRFFSNMPSSLEMYNPSKFSESLIAVETKDDDGHFHSYNDEPAYISEKRRGERFAVWYSHGKQERENNKPSRAVFYSQNEYQTQNVRQERHSNGDMPAFISASGDQECWLAEWYKDGLLHRDNDLPAGIDWSPTALSSRYYKKGLRHRENNLPAIDSIASQDWYVFDKSHNPNGPSHITKEAGHLKDRFRYAWGLYGAEISKTTFDDAKKISSEEKLPLWVAFLRAIKAVTFEETNSLKSSDNEWDNNLPLKWVLSCWGINEKTILEKTKSFHHIDSSFFLNNKSYYKYDAPKTMLEALVKITELERRNALEIN